MNNKRNIIFSIIAISLVLLMVIGATFAYFQAQINDGVSSEVAIDTDTVDILTFNATDDIMLEATQENFSREKGNISGSTILNAHLIANNTNQTASYKYNVYLDITKNNFVYSKNSNTPEIVLVVRNPQGQYVTTYNSKLGYTKNVDLNGESVPGYDITTKIGLIEISLNCLIEAKPSTKGIADQNWEISVIIVNLDSNQVANAGKSFKAKAKVQSEKINVLDLGGSSSYYKNTLSSSNYRNQIKNVYFVNHIVEEELNSVGTDANWDLSSVKDKSIIGWLKEENEDETAPYNLYIGSNLKEGEKIIVRSFAYAFYDMRNLETIDLNLDILDTSNLNDTSNMFYNNFKLTTITGIENLDVTNVANMSYMFSNARGLTELDLSKWDTSNVTNMSYMFATAINLDSINISNWNTHNVKDMSWMFAANLAGSTMNLSSIRGIEDIDVSSVTNMEHMFSSTKLTKLDLSSWDTSNVTNMFCMFNSANKLISLNLDNWNVQNVTDMRMMFASTALNELKVKNWKLNKNLSFYNSSSHSSIFSRTALTHIDGIDTWDVSEIINMSYLFYKSSNLIELNLSNWNTYNVTNMSNMFYEASGLTSVGNISNWDTSSVTNMSYMFSYTNSLTELDMDTSSVTNMSHMFSNYKGTEIIGIKDLNVSNVTDMSNMFSSASSLIELDLSNWDTHNVINMSDMFSNTNSLKNIDMRKATFSQLTSYSYMFRSTNSELKVTITGDANKNWFLDKIANGSNFGLKESQLDVLPS